MGPLCTGLSIEGSSTLGGRWHKRSLPQKSQLSLVNSGSTTSTECPKYPSWALAETLISTSTEGHTLVDNDQDTYIHRMPQVHLVNNSRDTFLHRRPQVPCWTMTETHTSTEGSSTPGWQQQRHSPPQGPKYPWQTMAETLTSTECPHYPWQTVTKTLTCI